MLYWRRVKVETTAPLGRHQRFKTSPHASAFRDRCFPEATAADWNDWRWQLRNRYKTVKQLSQILNLTEDERNQIESIIQSLSSNIKTRVLLKI